MGDYSPAPFPKRCSGRDAASGRMGPVVLEHKAKRPERREMCGAAGWGGRDGRGSGFAGSKRVQRELKGSA